MKYFAYGSNMSLNRMTKRGITFSQRRFAMLKCFRLEFNKVASDNPKAGYASIVHDANCAVEGALYEIQNADINKLDKFEGYPDHYQKIKVTVQEADGQEIEALTYIAHPDKVRDGLKPSKEYMQHLLAGKDVLSESYYRRLEKWATLD
jgi:gamma-glutamylcyclotransferase (GGCT)/AIG2-like uncharacterized protein YtfP